MAPLIVWVSQRNRSFQASPSSPLQKNVDAEFWAALVPSRGGAHLDRELSCWFLVGHTCSGGQPSFPCAAVASSCLLSFSNYGSRHLFGEHSVAVAEGLCLPGHSCFLLFGSDIYPVWPVVWYVWLTTDMVKPEVFLGCCLSSLGFFCSLCCDATSSCCASCITALISFSDWPAVSPGSPVMWHTLLCHLADCPSLRVRCLRRTAQLEPWSFLGQCGADPPLHAEGAERCSSHSLAPWAGGQVQSPDADCLAGGMVESFCRRQGLRASAPLLCQQQAFKWAWLFSLTPRQENTEYFAFFWVLLLFLAARKGVIFVAELVYQHMDLPEARRACAVSHDLYRL